MNYTVPITYFVISIIAVTLIDTVGAIASRKLKFKYGYLSFLSLAVYFALAYLNANYITLVSVVLVNAVLGFYDGTVGFWLSIILKANNGLTAEQVKKAFGFKSGLVAMVIAEVTGLIAIIIWSLLK